VSPELFSIIVLVVIFVVATVWPINLGVMGFVAAFLVGTLLGGLSAEDIFDGFPANLFILLAGITLLFAIAQKNGTIDLLMDWGLRLVRGNVGFIPWIMFALTTLLCGVGALSAAGVAIIAPIALQSAAQYRINPLMMGILVVQGATAGSYSPISPFGVITNGVLESNGLPQAPGLLFVNSLVFNTLVAALVFVAFGGLRLLQRRIDPEELEESYKADDDSTSHRDESEEGNKFDSAGENRGGLTPYRGATLAGIAILIVLALVFNVDVGFAAFTIALALMLMAPRAQAGILREVPWPVILLISGILTYVEVLDKIGTIDYVENLISNTTSPLIAALAASYVGGVISAFASTAGILGVALPLAGSVLQDPAIPAIGAVTAVAIASAIVDVSPFSTNGALLLANVQGVEQRVFFRQLLLWALAVTALAPLLAWLVFVVIGIP
jgi:Na+/H+ antiporter NhaD/arsenite permease-like protein